MRNPADEKIITCLRAGGPHTIAQIARMLDMSYVNARNRIDALSLAGEALAEDDEGKIMVIEKKDE
ncbi:MAG: hypothetical protein LBT33_11100 [Spirochaetia bacterium]|nr:hypothetical protein [Spirochaetia bacterium]